MDPLTILLLLGGGALLSSLFGGGAGDTTPEVSGEYPEGEVLGEYPGGLFTFESLTPEQKQVLQSLMSYAIPKLGLPGQAFGQAPAGTTGQPVPWAGSTAGAGAGVGAGVGGKGMAQGIMPMLSQLLMGGGSPSKGLSRGGGR